MRRREFITVLASAAAWPLAVRAQQGAMPVVGFLHTGVPEPSEIAAFHKGLGETGYIEGRNVAIEYRWAQSELSRLPDLATDLLRRRVTVIAAAGTSAAALASRPQPRQFRSSSSAALTRSRPGWSQASTGPAAT
jgi:putative ABC transport system substrate-binding protein